MIVIDASSVAKYVLKEENWREIREYLLYSEVFSLDLMLKEVLNAIWKHYSIFRSIPIGIAYAKKNILFKLTDQEIIRIEPQHKYLEPAFDFALKNKATIYDSLYIVQALQKQAQLLTSDKKQAETAEKHGVSTIFIP